MSDVVLIVEKIGGYMEDFDKVVGLLEEYKKEYGNCLVPQRYITKDGVKLGLIVFSIRRGLRKTSQEEKEKLDSLEFVWRVNSSPLSIERIIAFLEEYKEKYGDCCVPQSYITEDGIKLGELVRNIKSGKRKISQGEKEKLDSIGFAWRINNTRVSIEKIIELLVEYKEEHGNCCVSRYYITKEGISLGQMVRDIRGGKRKISHEEKEKLDSIGFVWRVNSSPLSIEQVICLLEEYKEKYGDYLVPAKYTTEEGIHFGKIVRDIRHGRRKISQEEKTKLDNLGFVWNITSNRN